MARLLGSDHALDACVRACETAERACSRAMSCALEIGGAHADPEFLRLLMECSRSCARSGQILVRGWWEQGPVCLECAELCEVCADECGGAPDPAFAACADACRACARCCRHLASNPPREAMAEDDTGDAA